MPDTDPSIDATLAELATVTESDLDRLIAELADFAPDVAALLQALELDNDEES